MRKILIQKRSRQKIIQNLSILMGCQAESLLAASTSFPVTILKMKRILLQPEQIQLHYAGIMIAAAVKSGSSKITGISIFLTESKLNIVRTVRGIMALYGIK